jgi:hypothetical protein
MVTRRHDAHTTRTPQAMVPAQVLPQVRCPVCRFMFFGTLGSRCEMCRAKEGPHEDHEAPDGPTTDAEAAALITQALDALPPDLERRLQDQGTRMEALERKIAATLEELSRLRQRLTDLLGAEGGTR